MLEPSGETVWPSPETMPPDQCPEVVVTDFEKIEGDAGVVRIGGSGRADVRLPDDLTARELQLACRLLAQVVRLRRREHCGAELRRRLAAEALTDPLSGLPNRRAWDREVERRLSATSSSRRLCMAVLDLDHFKQVNDAHGHAVGDRVLRAWGRAVRDGLRQDDFVARLGGDEFGLLLWVVDAGMAVAVVDRVRAAVPRRPADSALPTVTASAGCCVAPSDSQPHAAPSPEDVYAAAVAALRDAKQQGRDRTVGHNS